LPQEVGDGSSKFIFTTLKLNHPQYKCSCVVRPKNIDRRYNNSSPKLVRYFGGSSSIFSDRYKPTKMDIQLFSSLCRESFARSRTSPRAARPKPYSLSLSLSLLPLCGIGLFFLRETEGARQFPRNVLTIIPSPAPSRPVLADDLVYRVRDSRGSKTFARFVSKPRVGPCTRTRAQSQGQRGGGRKMRASGRTPERKHPGTCPRARVCEGGAYYVCMCSSEGGNNTGDTSPRCRYN
jgi:hypothetical protein